MRFDKRIKVKRERGKKKKREKDRDIFLEKWNVPVKDIKEYLLCGQGNIWKNIED